MGARSTMQAVLRRPVRMGRAVGASLIGVILVAAASATLSGAPATAAPRSAPAHAPHVMVLFMENTDYSQFTGSPEMPYLNELAHEYADFTQAYGWSYPSLPNYLELLAGTDFGIQSDCDITDKGCNNFVHEKIVDQLEAAGLSWGAYYQGDDNGCDQGDENNSNYPYWHNSFRYFADFAQQCSHISNFTTLLPSLDSSKAPDFAWVVPDLVNSGGDNGTMSSGDTFLASEIPQIMASSWYRRDGQIVIIYDTGYEDSGGIGTSSGGHIPLVVVSARDRGMGQIDDPVNTAGVLRSVERAYGFSLIGDAADAANGSLGRAITSKASAGEETGTGAFEGAVVSVSASGAAVRPEGPGTLALEGESCPSGGSCVDVGTTGHGTGVIVEGGAVHTVPGTANLESVSCSSASKCEAVGLATADLDEAVVVALTKGAAPVVTDVPAFIGLYGVDCVSSSTCYAVGYDNADDAGAVTTITDGVAAAPQEVSDDDGVPWLNAISCPSATQCYAAGLWSYEPAIVPIDAGVPGTAVVIKDSWYANGINCTAVGDCVVVGENDANEGTVAALVNGKVGSAQVVAGTEYLYGVGCASDGKCLLAGTSTVGTTGYGSGALSIYQGGVAKAASPVRGTNGLDQVVCGASTSACVTIGSSISDAIKLAVMASSGGRASVW